MLHRNIASRGRDARPSRKAGHRDVAGDDVVGAVVRLDRHAQVWHGIARSVHADQTVQYLAAAGAVFERDAVATVGPDDHGVRRGDIANLVMVSGVRDQDAAQRVAQRLNARAAGADILSTQLSCAESWMAVP